MTRGKRLRSSVGWTASLPWVLYVALVAASSRTYNVGRPLDVFDTILAMVPVVAWALVAGLVSVQLTIAILRRAGPWPAAVVAVGLPFISCASAAKYVLIGQHLTVTDIGFFVRYTALAFDASVALAGLIALVCFLGLGVIFRQVETRGEANKLSSKRVVAVALIWVIGALAILSIFPKTRAFSRSYMPEIAALGSLVSPLKGAGTFVHYNKLSLSDDDVSAATITPLHPAPPSADDLPNVVIIMIDGVRHAHLGVGGGPAGVTPNIDQLARHSVTFSRAYTTATHSDYAQTAFLSGLHPRKFRGHDYFTVNYPRTLIWDVLKPLGYQTAVFSTHNENWGDMLRFLKTPKIDVFRHAPDYPNAPRKGRGSDTAVPESVVVNDWAAWRSEHPGRHLSYLNFQVTHFPYAIPPGAARPFQPDSGDFNISFVRYPKGAVPVMKNRFFNALHHADRWVGEVIATLKRLGEWDNTVLVLASDHGEAFYEHEQPTHGTSLYEEQVQSMLIVRLPGQTTRVVDDPVSLVDAMPSLVDWLKLGRHPEMQGRPWILRETWPPRRKCAPRFFTIQGLASMDGAVNCTHKVIVDVQRKRVQCFDLAESPGEKTDRWAAGEDRACRQLYDALQSFLDRQITYYERELWKKGRHPRPLGL